MKQLWSVSTIAISVAVCVSCGGSSGNSNPPGAVNGCSNFTDATAATASRMINFGGSGNTYSPNCLAVAVGQQVTWTGSFNMHPLAPGVAPSQTGSGSGSPNNPIQSTNSGNSATFNFATAGTYPYYCTVHQGVGMFGAIQVR
jgi:plastocyanin